jgi:hypothetical protein
MRGFFGGIGLAVGGAAVGAFSAYLAIQNAGVEAVSTGSPWLSRAATLQGGSGFYVRLHYLIEGRLPPAQGQIVEATAETDADGQPLTTGCRYRIASAGPLPRWWSIAAEGSGNDPLSRQTVIDSDTVIREANGTVKLVASLGPQSGNWLKVPDARRFTLLYSAIPAGGQSPSTAPPFSITREGC